REDSADHVLRVTVLAQDFGAELRVALIRVTFVIEIVEHPHDPPFIFVFAVFAGVSSHGVFDGARVFAQAVALGPFAEQAPGFFACRHSDQSPEVNCLGSFGVPPEGGTPNGFSTLILSARQEDRRFVLYSAPACSRLINVYEETRDESALFAPVFRIAAYRFDPDAAKRRSGRDSL